MSSVRVWMEKTQIPTYPVGKPDKNPMFLEKRVYQGSSGKVYPHTVIDTVSDQKEMCEYTALYLENEYLLIMVLPEIGGRVQRALDKTNGYDFVYYNRVIKPAMVGLAGPWLSGGIEFNWPQHHRPSTFDPVAWKIEENADGSASIVVGEIETMFRTKGMSRMTLRPGKAYLEIENQLFNRTAQPQTFLWWANPAVAVNANTRSIFPPDVHAVMDHGKRDVSAFPIAHGVYYKNDYSAGVDISRYRNIPVPTSYMAAHSDEDFVGNYDDGVEAGMLHVADHHISPGKKQWTWGNGEFGLAWDRQLTDEDGPYIELMAGCFTDNQPDFSWLMPGEEKRFTQYFMPYKGVGAVKKASRDAVIGLEREAGRAVVRVYATAERKGCSVYVEQEGKVLLCEQADLSPLAHWEKSFCAPEGLLSVKLCDGTGRTLLCYREKAQEDMPLPSPAEAIPAAAEVETNERLLRYGRHIEQYRHATWDAAEYYLEGLRRDPDDAAMHNAYGKLLLGRGLVAQSIEHFQCAVRTSMEKNPNPYDGECLYNLGVALELAGKPEEAYEAYFKAAWNGAWQNTAYYRIGCIDMRRGQAEAAEEHLRNALIHGAHDLLSRNALTVLLRKQGRTADALALARESARMDPLDMVADREMALLQGEEEKWDETLAGMPNPYIELALEYARCGAVQDATAVLKRGLDRSGYPLLAVYLYWCTGEEAWIARAEELSPDGCFPHRQEDAIALEAALAARSDSAHIACFLGNYWYDKRQYERAVQLWQRSTEICPDYATAHRNLSLALYNRFAQPERAYQEMQTAFAKDPTDARVYMELDALRERVHIGAQERLEDLQKHMDLVTQRDDLSLSYITLLNHTGHYAQALEYMRGRNFHPWEGGEGKVPAQWRVSLIMFARREMEEGRLEQALARLQEAAGPYPYNLGEGRLPSTRENDALFWIGVCLEKMGRDQEAQQAFAAAACGDTEPTGMLYYNDQPPEMIFYAGLAMRSQNREAEAQKIFARLCAYAAEHMDDEVRTEYFAVSLPELQIFEEDLCARNRVHCLFMLALGRLGLGDRAGARAAIKELRAIRPAHQGAHIHAELYLESIEKP